jgi:tetratricopeptide (TPR) repeat protein
VQRLAILPLDNLSSDPKLNWYSRAAAAVVEYDLAGSKNLYAKTEESVPASQAMQASRALEGYFLERNGRLMIRATVEDLRTTKAVDHLEIEGPAGGGWLPLANELARRLNPEARAFGTRSEDALRFYGEALDAGTVETREHALESAVAADPAFATAYLTEARLLAETGAKDRALAAIGAGRRTRLDAIDRADFQFLAAATSGDVNARVQALEALSRATPANAALFSQLGQMQYARREFADAVRSYQAATVLNPDEPSVWNEMGYAIAWTGNLNGAVQAIQEYQKLAPENTNALDSLGEVSFFLGDFASAAKYFDQAAQKFPAELLKAAEARLMLGDLQNADALMAKYLKPAQLAQRDRAAFQMTQWEFLTGRRAQASDALQALLPRLDPDSQSLALSQLAIWKLKTGDAQHAADFANQAVAHAQSPQTRGMAAVSRFLAAGTGAASGSPLVDAYALLLSGKFQPAVPLLQKVYEAANPSTDGQVRVLLAWARAETGGLNEADKLTQMCPLPLSSGETIFASLIFPRYFAIRAAVAGKQGKTAEAKKDLDLFVKYGATARLVLGDAK